VERLSGLSTAAAAPARGYANWVLFLLLLAYVLNFVDRQVLAIVGLEVKAEMGLSDTQLGLLLGPYFALSFTLAGFVIARIADVASRRNVLVAGLAAWSLLTAACGVARSFAQLATLRFAVAVGEAAGTPPSHSILSDYFPPQRRATAMAVYGLGIYVGTGFGFAGGGLLLEWFDWRTAFVAAGLAGLPVALLIVATVREPARGGGVAGARATAPPLRRVLPEVFATRAFRWLMAAAACQAFLGYAVLSWGATYLRRVFEMTPGEAGVWFGGIAAVAGGLGSLGGGVLADRLARRDPRWYAWLSALVSLAAFPFAAVFALAEERAIALAAFAPFYLLNNLYVASLWTLVQGLVAPGLRATASATQLAVTNLVGYGVGPALVGFANDALAPSLGAGAIRWSLLGAAIVGAASAMFFWQCGRTLREDLNGPDFG
jgi:predicted MFS family arabinose efflux permease